MVRLAARRPLFHSEADFQHELAWELRSAGAADVRVERPVTVEGPDGSGSRRLNLDLLIKLAGKRVAIELKYWTRRLRLSHGGEDFNLADQGAQDQKRFDFWADVSRLEALVAQGVVDAGFAIALSNDTGYWKQGRTGTTDEGFRLHHGRAVEGTLAWAENTSAGTKGLRSDSLALRGRYSVLWQPYSTPANCELRFLQVEASG